MFTRHYPNLFCLPHIFNSFLLVSLCVHVCVGTWPGVHVELRRQFSPSIILLGQCLSFLPSSVLPPIWPLNAGITNGATASRLWTKVPGMNSGHQAWISSTFYLLGLSHINLGSLVNEWTLTQSRTNPLPKSQLILGQAVVVHNFNPSTR